MKLPAPVENLLQRFRREQREDQTVVMRLRGEIDRLKREQSTLQEESLRRAYQTLFADASSPVSQLLLQGNRFTKGGLRTGIAFCQHELDSRMVVS